MDSRTIIDSSGAEKLLGKGDMLFMTTESSKVKRIQGAYVTDEEINDITEFLRQQGEPSYNNDVTEKMAGSSVMGMGRENRADELLEEAKEIVVRSGKASATLLQRRLRIGYARAAGLLDSLEQQGVVGQAQGAKAREVLISQDDLENNFSSSLDETEEDDVDESDDEEEKVLADSD
jgi:S-DNA-T family DNA segregation ATPase FtsK/SpoIIIE